MRGTFKMRRAVSTTTASLLAVALLALPAAAQVKDHKAIKYPDLPDFKIPRPEVYDLDNGMKVFLMEDHAKPVEEAVSGHRATLIGQ